MSEMQDRQLEHELSQLGQHLTQDAPERLPVALESALCAKRRATLVRRVAMAAAVVLVTAGAAVVYMAANAWTPAPKPEPIVRTTPKPSPVPELERAKETSPQSIASMKLAWERTGEADPPVTARSQDAPMRAGDFRNPADLEPTHATPR